MPNTLTARCVFCSNTTGTTYLLNVSLSPLQTINTLDRQGCLGYPIFGGTFTTVGPNGIANTNLVPEEKALTLFNGLWPTAADPPDEAGSPNCRGVDRLSTHFSPSNNNTTVFAIDANHIAVVFGFGSNDDAVLVMSTFPPATK